MTSPSQPLLEELRHRLQTDGDNTDFAALLERILTRFDCVVGTIHAFDFASQRLILRAQRGIPPSIQSQVESIPLGKGMAGLAAQRREPVQVCNLQSDDSGVAKPAARDTRMEGAISLPMLVDGALRGTLGVSKPQAHEFSASEVEELMQIGALLGAHLQL